MKLFIDADGCPVVDIAVEIAKNENLECIIVCDTSHIFQKEGAQTITVSKGADSVDFALVNMLQRGDIAITQDYGLAAMCLSRGARVISQDGLEYSDDNIEAMLFERHTSAKLRGAGLRQKGKSKRTQAQNESFAQKLKSITVQ